MNLHRVLLAFLVGAVLIGGPATNSVIWAQEETPEAAAEGTPAEEEVVEEVEEVEEEAAEEEAPMEFAADVSVNDVAYAIDNIMLFLCAVLVLFMQAGFSMVEAGFNASKNTVNILFKNVMDLCLGAILFWVVGYNLMYPGFGEGDPGYFKFGGFGISSEYASNALFHPQVDWLFQVAFAATAATIVSGAVAGRMKFQAYLIYSVVLTGLIYPISGAWQWGSGFLSQAGYHDFAGSLIVHAVGGFAGLAGAIVLGPRIGRYSEDGKSQPMLGHNMPIAALGVFILLIGWFGFNPGSVLAFSDAGSAGTTMIVAVNTLLAAATGGVIAMTFSWVMFGKPDLSMALNGILAGLVGITANADVVTNVESFIIGGVAGGLVVIGIVALDKLKIDDPVGAFPVHGLCGFWGGLATGIFGEGKDIVVQTWGSAVYCIWAFVTMFILFTILKAVGILRVPAEEEIEGLDIVEHGMPAYNN
ncbi:MAG: ammonium transporter [Planctomycetaceae bacterium]|nr:ammonium transporter [Planctomycetaceae bacterium]